jgi:D-inositol-3-phosphate glycosyltransferase
MRVALVSFAGVPDAPELTRPDGQVAALADRLAERGDEVVLFARRQRASDRAASDQRRFRTVQLPAGPPEPLPEAEAITHLGEYVAALGERLRRFAPDVVHSHNWVAGLATHLARRDRRLPVVHTFHRLHLEHGGQQASGGQVRAERAIAMHADRVIALSHAEQGRLVRAGVPHRRIIVVPPGVDTELLRPEGPADERARRYRLVLFGPPRQAVPAVQALTALPDTELVVVDTRALPEQPEPDDAGRLRAYAATLGVEDRVLLLAEPGSAHHRAGLIRSADLVLAYPAPDRWGHGHLEAMACGVPVVAGTAQAEEAVVDGVTGIHASDADPRRLAKAVRSLLEGGTLRQGMGLAGRDRATGRYSWARISEETARVYEELRQPAATQAEAKPVPDLPTRHPIAR